MKYSIYVTYITLIFTLLVGCTGNQNIKGSMVDVDMANWDTISKITVQFPPASTDKLLTLPYEIPIKISEKSYRRFRIVVQDWAVKIIDLRITLDNNKVWEPDMKGLYKKDSASKIIDIPDSPRKIKNINVKFWTRGTIVNMPATVFFWGEKSQ